MGWDGIIPLAVCDGCRGQRIAKKRVKKGKKKGKKTKRNKKSKRTGMNFLTEYKVCQQTEKPSSHASWDDFQ